MIYRNRLDNYCIRTALHVRLEFKYYHYLPTTWNVTEDLRKKVIMLKTLKNLGIRNDAGVLLLDDALCRRDYRKCREVKTV